MSTEVTTNVAVPAAAVNQAATPAPAAADAKPGAEAAKPEPVTPAAVEKAEPELSGKFAALTRRERAISDREKAVKAQEKEFSEFKKAKERAKLDPVALLESHGLTYQQVTEYLMNDKTLSPERRIELLEERLEGDKTKKETDAKAAETAEVQAQIDAHKAECKEFIDSKPDDYEIIRANDAHDTVHEVVRQHWEETGEILPMEAAAQAVETYLETLIKEKLLNLKKFQPKPGTVKIDTDPNAVPAITASPNDSRPAPTLTNAATASAPAPNSNRHLSDEESVAAAAKLIVWNN